MYPGSSGIAVSIDNVDAATVKTRQYHELSAFAGISVAAGARSSNHCGAARHRHRACTNGAVPAGRAEREVLLKRVSLGEEN